MWTHILEQCRQNSHLVQVYVVDVNALAVRPVETFILGNGAGNTSVC